MIKWGKSVDGFVESKCGRFSISPEYWGRVNPQSYTLFDRKTKKEYKLIDTQKLAKKKADEILNPKPKPKPIKISDDLF